MKREKSGKKRSPEGRRTASERVLRMERDIGKVTPRLVKKKPLKSPNYGKVRLKTGNIRHTTM